LESFLCNICDSRYWLLYQLIIVAASARILFGTDAYVLYCDSLNEGWMDGGYRCRPQLYFCLLPTVYFLS